ncbi:MAG: DsbA family oxidoreductase [Aquabacterium sp.]
MHREEKVLIEVHYDLVCPFCLIGKTQVDAAVAALGRDVQFSWRPFILDPALPAEGMGFQAYHGMKYGARSRAMQQHVERIGQRMGIPFDFLKLSRYPNTLDGHRAVKYAEEHGRAGAMVEALLRAYFLDDQDIGRPEVLAEVAHARVGLPADELLQRLSSDWQVEAVHADHRRAVRGGVQSVPSYRIDGRYVEHTGDLITLLSGHRPATLAH